MQVYFFKKSNVVGYCTLHARSVKVNRDWDMYDVIQIIFPVTIKHY